MNRPTERISQRLQDGQDEALGELLEQVRERLLRIIAFRLDQRLRGRLDPDDIFQELALVATQRLRQYRQAADPMPAFLWLRYLAIQKTIELNRVHLKVAARSVEREVSQQQLVGFADTTVELAARLLGNEPTPSEVARRNELTESLQTALKKLEPIDREVLELRQYEQLSNDEAAQVLGIKASAASSRYVRAIKRLKLEMIRHEEH
jgi:RNA polymerase sigma-70 factor, ECF subfamily